MKQTILIFCVLFTFGLSLDSRTQAIAQEPIPIIFDTDIGNDVDDVLALGVIHALETRKECQLLGVTITKDHELAAPFVDAVNTFYGRGAIPIGVCRSKVTPDQGKFNGLAEVKDDGRYRYPHDLISGKDAPEAVAVLRSLLTNAKDGSVVMIQVGFSTNYSKLLESPADAASPLTGRDLVKQKVRLCSVMAGAFTPIDGKEFSEYNIVQDLASSKSFAENWPTPIVFSGFEIGIAVAYPAQSIVEDYRYVEHHPLAEAYRLYEPPPHNRPTWDLTSVLYAVRPNRDYFDVSEAGTVNVNDKGVTTFQSDKEGRHRYLKLRVDQIPKVTEALVQLSSEPPSK